MLSNAVVIGASGAIGKAFVEQFIASDNISKIHAFSRSEVRFSSSKVSVHKIDLESEDSIKEAVNIATKNQKIDIIIVAIGVLHGEDFAPEKSLRDLSSAKFKKLFAINTIAPALIAKHFLPHLNKESKSIFAALSARVGSISDNHLGGWYSYRASKAALNMILKNSAIEIKRSNKNAIIIGLHPGTVDSNLSKPFQGNVAEGKLFTPEFSTQKMFAVINNLEPKDSGKVFDFNGIEVLA